MTTKKVDAGTVNGWPADRDPVTGTIEVGPHVTRRQAAAGELAVRSVERSPMNARRWFVSLACGHGVWLTASRRPARKTMGCSTCATAEP